MSGDNVRVVVKQFEDTNAREFRAVMEAYADDVTLTFHGEAGLLRQAASGRAAVGEWFGDWFRQFGPDYRFHIDEARGVDDRVFLIATHSGRGRGSGVPVRETWAYRYTVREGRVSGVELWGGHDARDTALAAAGVQGGRVELVRRGFDAFNDHDLDAVLALYADDVEWRMIGGLADLIGGEVTGRDALGRFFSDWIENLGGGIEVESMFEAGDRVVSIIHLTSAGGSSGAPTTQRLGEVFTFRGSEICAVDNYWNADEALISTGLRL